MEQPLIDWRCIRDPRPKSFRKPEGLSSDPVVNVTLEMRILFAKIALNRLRSNRPFQMMQIVRRANLVKFHSRVIEPVFELEACGVFVMRMAI